MRGHHVGDHPGQTTVTKIVWRDRQHHSMSMSGETARPDKSGR